MRSFCKLSLLCTMMVLSIAATKGFSEDVLLDDFNDGDSLSEFGTVWQYYDDNYGIQPSDRPQADPETTPSVINVTYTERARNYDGNPGDTHIVKDYEITLDGSDDKFLTMPFTLGEKYNAHWCEPDDPCAFSYAGISVPLAPPGAYIDLTGANGVSFKIRSRNTSLKVRFTVETYGILMDSTWAHYQILIDVEPEWETVTIPFASLEQPEWAEPYHEPFEIKKVVNIVWEIPQEYNGAVISGTLDIDDITIDDYSYTYVPPLLVDDFEQGGHGSRIGTSWYFWNDSSEGGSSVVNNAGPHGEFTGGYTPGYNSDYAGIMDFTLGPDCDDPETGIGINFDPEEGPVDMRGALAVQFDIKGNSNMQVHFRVPQSTITDFDYYYRSIDVTTFWRRVTVLLEKGKRGLEQSGWGDVKPLNLEKLTGMQWCYREHGPSNKSGMISIDNIKIIGNQTGLESPYPPILISPGWKSEGNPTTTTLVWSEVEGATSYRVQVDTTPTLKSSVLIADETTSDTTHMVTLVKGTTYYWRVKATIGAQETKWSSRATFTTLFDIPQKTRLATPRDSSNGVSRTPKLSWNKTKGAKTYQVQVSNTSDFTTTVIEKKLLTDTTYTMTSTLATGTCYFWRVRAINAAGNGEWSSPWHFITIEALPPAPLLLTPVESATSVALTPEFSWEVTERAVSYTLQISESSTFSPVTVNKTGILSTTYSGTELENGITYYWRVRAENSGGSGPWSESRVFTTQYLPAAKVVLSNPADAAKNVAVSTMLSWNAAENAFSYQLQVSIEPEFTTTIIDEDEIAVHTWAASSLENNTVYYWRVRGINPDGAGPWSTVRSFTTIASIPGAPSLIAPANEATSVPVTPKLVWSKLSDAVSYNLQLSKSEEFEGFVVNQTEIADTQLAVSALLNKTVYYWRVAAVNESGTGPWSSPATFTTVIAAPGTVSPLIPIDGAERVRTSPKFVWAELNGAISYGLEIATDTAFKKVVRDSAGITDTTLTVKGLKNDTRYYWRINARNAGGNGPWCARRTFRTIMATPDTVKLVTTSDTITTKKVKLIWNGSKPRITMYYIEIAANKAMDEPMIDSTSDTTLTVSGLTNRTKYWWRVRAANDAGKGEFSSKGSFVMDIPVPVTTERPFGVKVFSVKATEQGIRYTIPTKCMVSASIFNIKGSVVRKLADSYKSAGVYTIPISDLTSGTYYIHFTAGTYRHNGKFIITR